MSLTALLIAVRDQLRSDIPASTGRSPALPDVECDVQEGPEPDPMCGKRFVSIYGIQNQAGPSDVMLGVDALLGVGCCVTFRANAFPKDRANKIAYTTVASGMEKYCSAIVRAIHQNDYLVAYANALITASAVELNETEGVTEHLRWMRTDPAPISCDNAWFSSNAPNPTNAVTGYRMTVYFGNARRLQSFSVMQ